MASPSPASPAPTGLTTTASLGTLAHFPKELRLDIYDLVAATDQSAREVNFYKPCKRGSVLSALSRQIHIESKAAVAQVKLGPCQHTEFKITLPAYADFANRDYACGLLEAQMPWGQQHEAKGVESMRFFTAHLGQNVPLAVIIKLRAFGKSTIAVYGASAERRAVVEEGMAEDLQAMAENFKSSKIDVTRPSNAVGSKNDEIHISDLSAIAEKLRDLVCVDLEESKDMKEWQDGEQ